MESLIHRQGSMCNLGLIYLFIIVSFSSCDLRLDGNHLGVSRSLKESKEEGFFIDEYEVARYDKKSDTTIELSFSEAFVEHIWRSNNNLSKSQARGYQMIVNLNNSMPEGYMFEWVCEIENGKSFSDFDSTMLLVQIPLHEIKDTIKANLFQGDVFYKDSTLRSTGQIVFARKDNPNRLFIYENEL